ncbi:MAG: KdsC family phosphatase [Pseudomonadales bacterium]
MYSQDLQNRANRVRLVVFDVDGVLTDGKLYYSSDGSEIKAFHVQDGAALKLLQRSGLQVAIITGRQSTMVARRAEELGVSLLRQNANNKLETLNALLVNEASLKGVTLAECACVGDDLADIVLFEAVGLGIGVPNGHPSSHKAAHWITSAAGGQGVAREVCEMLLRNQGSWPYP